MENVVLTQLSVPDIKRLFRQELESFFESKSQTSTSVQPVSEQLLTVEEAAKFLTLAVPTIYSLVQRKEIPVCKRGKRLYFSEKELTEWVKGGRKKTREDIEGEAIAYLGNKKRG